MSSSAANGYFPDDRGGILKKVDNWPTGYSNDGIFGYIIDGDKYIRTKKGILNCEEVGIYANGSDMTARINTVFAHAWVKAVEFDVEQGGGNIVVNGAVTIPAGKVLKFASGTKLTGTGSFTGGIIDANDRITIFGSTLTARPAAPKGTYWPAQWWGLVADGQQTTINNAGVYTISYTGTDNQPAFQKCVDFVIQYGYSGSNEIRVNPGKYKISKGITFMQTGAFVNLSIIGQPDSAYFPAGETDVSFYLDSYTDFCFGPHLGKGLHIEGFILQGKFMPPHAMENDTAQFYAQKFSQYTDGQSRDNIYSPNAGIAIDWCTNTGIYPGKSGNNDVPDVANCYPGREATYLINKASASSGSSGILIRNCFISCFVTPIIISPNGQSLNAECISVERVQFGFSKVAYATCQSQTRDNGILDCVAWGGCHTVVDNTSYAKYPQRGAMPYIDKINIAGTVIRCFNIISDGWYGSFIKNVTAESIMTIGIINSGLPCHIVDCEFKFIYAGEVGGAYARAYDYHVSSGLQVFYDNCTFRYYGTNYPIYLACNGSEFHNCFFSGFPIYQGAFDPNIAYNNRFISCYAGGALFGEHEDRRVHFGGNTASPGNIVPVGRTIVREMEREINLGVSYSFEFTASNYLGRRYLDSNTLSFASGVPTFTYSAQSTNPLYVGDVICAYGDNAVYEVQEGVGATIPFPPLGLVVAVNNTTGLITLDLVPFYATARAYTMIAVRAIPVSQPFMGTITAGSAVITNVECFTKWADNISVYDRDFPPIGSAYWIRGSNQFNNYVIVKAVDKPNRTVTFDVAPSPNSTNDYEFINYNPQITIKYRGATDYRSKELMKNLGLLFSGTKIYFNGYNDPYNPANVTEEFVTIRPGYHEDAVAQFPTQLFHTCGFRKDGLAVQSTSASTYFVTGWEDKIRVDCTNNNVTIIVGYVAGQIKKSIELERIDSSANIMSVTVNNDGGARTVNGASIYNVTNKKATIVIYSNSSVLVQESGAGSGGSTKDAFTLTGDGSRAISAGTDLISIRIKPVGALTSFKIGTSAGADDLATVDDAPAGVWSPTTINTFFESAATIYFSGITSSTSIVIIKL